RQGERGLTMPEQSEIHGGMLSPPRPAAVAGEQAQTCPKGNQDGGGAPAGEGAPARAVQREGEPGGQPRRADGVEPCLAGAGRGGSGWDAPQAEQAGQAEGDVDKEDRRPAADSDE